MDEDGFKPQAESIDGRFFIETVQTARATAALWALLQFARIEPQWLPSQCLARQPDQKSFQIESTWLRSSPLSIPAHALAPRRPSQSSEPS